MISEEVSAFHYVHGCALIGRTVDINILNKMDRILWEGGYVGVTIHYVGGLSLLLSFKDKEAAANFLLLQEVWRQWFTVLDMWERQTLAFERVAWLNVFGVPLHLADNSVFNEVASQFGMLVKPAQLSIDDDDLSMACVGVLVGDEQEIKDKVTLKWKNKSFHVWVTEVNDVWIPECMGVVGMKNDVMMEESVPQSSEFQPVDGEKLVGKAKPMVEEEEGLNDDLHGNFNNLSGNQANEVGPEGCNQEERENGGFTCSVADPGKKKKRRPKVRSPLKDKANIINRSPSEVERPKKGLDPLLVILLT
ncbi:hypothetical protein Hdeb2414_s0016g00486431 [Helianthus debilis subsp. tardiflorus]